MRNAVSQPAAIPDPGAVLAKAAFRAARALGLTQAELAAIIGVSGASVSRMKEGAFPLSGKPFELAACLVRVFRSLDAIVGGDAVSMRAWVAAENADLAARPRERMREVAGLIEVMNYLDAQRAPV